MAFAIYPKYSDFYCGEKPDLAALLKGIPSIHIISFACYINAVKHRDPHNLQYDLALFQKLIKNQNALRAFFLKRTMSNFISRLSDSGAQTLIFPIHTIIKLIQFEIENWKPGNFQQLTPAQEESILKAIFILNQIEEESYIKDVKAKEPDGTFETFILYMWPTLLPTMEFQVPKELILPLTYSNEFFKYLESHEKLKQYLKGYLVNNSCGSWQEYLKKLWLFYMGGLDKNANWFFFRIDAEYIESMAFMQEYVLDISKFDSDSYYANGLNINYKLFREKPVLKLADKFYVMTNWNFFLEKLYHSQKFDYYKCSGVQETYTGDTNKKWQAYNGDLGNFSEKKIFLKLAQTYFSQNANAIIEEDSAKKWNQDLYYRFNNEICFIEYKAVFLPMANKFDDIKKNIEDPGKLLKSVHQLAKQIISLAQNINKFENLAAQGFSKSDLHIYPLVVYADENWSLYGIREYYDQILKQELAKQDLGFLKVEDLVIIHIDVFYDYEKLFLEDKLPITEILKQHNIVRALFAEKFRQTPNHDNMMHMYGDAPVFLARAFKGRFTHGLDSTYYQNLLKELGIK